MVRTLLVRGMLAGIAAAAVAFVIASIVGEPPINTAIAFEHGQSMPGMHEDELVSRTVQATLGLGVAVCLYGAALGGIFALAYAFTYGRVGALTARATAVAVGAVGFAAMFLVPFLKYPANPPAIGDPETIGRRSALYVLMVLISVLGAIGAVMLGRSLVPRLGAWNAALVAGAAFVALAVVAGVALPSFNEVADDFPATALWRFRLASVATQLGLWTTLGVLFGALTERSARRAAGRSVAAPAVSVG